MKILAQLFRTMQTFHHVDEMFQWLAYVYLQQFNAQLVQFWLNKVNNSGQRSAQLRTMVRQDTTIPEPILVSEDVAQLAQRIAYEQRIYNSQVIDALFPAYRVSILRRYGLMFFAGCFVHANLLIPPKNEAASMDALIPLAVTVLLFLPQQPRFDIMPTIITSMNQGISAAATRGLLLPVTHQLITPRLSSEPNLPTLNSLIPHRKDEQLMLSRNPLSGTTVIANKSARRLFSVIDGQSNLATLCSRLSMSMTEAYAALQILLSQQRIEVRSPDGALIDTKSLLKDSR